MKKTRLKIKKNMDEELEEGQGKPLSGGDLSAIWTMTESIILKM